MATKKKMLEAAAGGAGGAGLDITDVFSTYLYEGNGAARTITNGIDLAGEGGLVWLKSRTEGQSNYLFDTENGANKFLISESTANLQAVSNRGVTAFNSGGFDLGSSSGGNRTANNYTSWTFRKAPKFFDVVTYTGNGSSNRQIAHNLGSTPGFILIKRTDSTGNWLAWHKEVNPGYGMLDLTLAFTAGANGFVNAVADTYFETSWLNTSGATYVAYLFAHNNSDGEFGPDSDQDIIKCGSYTGNGNYTTGNEVNVGFEPQWVMIKNASRYDGNSDWVMYDTMRGFTATNEVQPGLFANLSDAETASGGKSYQSFITTSGFTLMDSNEAINYNGDTYIYMAIRRGPLALAEDVAGTDLFSPAVTYNETSLEFNSGFVTDMMMYRNLGASIYNNDMKIGSRLTGKQAMRTDSSSAESTYNPIWDFMEGAGAPVNSDFRAWMWKRAPGLFDVVAYTGDNVAGRTISHNLGVAPEMMWVKKRGETGDWNVYHSGLGPTKTIWLNQTSTGHTHQDYWYNTAPTSSVFSVGGGNPNNYTTRTYIAYLFATLAGVSKVGSVTHSGTTNVDCGFSAGARLVILKRTDAAGDWYVWDSVRGIIAGNDPYLLLNTAAAQVTNTDYIDPLSSGFTITSTFTAGDYIFYAIA